MTITILCFANGLVVITGVFNYLFQYPLDIFIIIRKTLTWVRFLVWWGNPNLHFWKAGPLAVYLVMIVVVNHRP